MLGFQNCTHPLPASLWQQCFYIPSILYRLNGLVIADELRKTIAKGINTINDAKYENILQEIIPRFYTWDPLTFERAPQNDGINNIGTSTEVTSIDTGDHILVQQQESNVSQEPNPETNVSFDAQTKLINFPGPSPSLILQAITTAKSQDAFDLER